MGRTKISFPKKKPVAPVDGEPIPEPEPAAVAAVPTVEKSVGKKARKRRMKQGRRALMEIKKYQKSTEPVLLKAPFQRLVREIASQYHSNELRFQKSAMVALQTAAEEYLTSLYSDSYTHVTLNSRRKTLSKKDLRIAMALRRNEGASNAIPSFRNE